MPKLIIDHREIEVAPGTKVIEAAEQLGIMIPRFCFHPALGAVGACRVCAVKFLEGPVKGIQMSCMVEAKDGMVVLTTDKEAVDFRKQIIEWLMLNHPHDCPVCDEGGHCLLQDMTVSGGHGIRNFPGRKRTYPDQYLGPLLQHEMNRCIHCYRCVRYYQQYSGYLDLGVMRSADRTYFGRFEDGILQSPFSGNLSDICPTGVFTDKPSRFFGRRWDFQRSPSICLNCSLGCHTIADVRYREVKRQEARVSAAVNGHFICDRGRYGFFYASNKSRPRQAAIEGRQVPVDEALDAARQRLEGILRQTGPGAVAAAGSARCSLQTQTALKHLCRRQGWQPPVFFADSSRTGGVKTAISRLEPGLAVSLREVEKADFILAVGADPINEAPMLAIAMRQAQRNGAGILVIDPRPVTLPFEFAHLPVPPADLAFYLAALIRQTIDRDTANLPGAAGIHFYDALPEGNGISATHAEAISAAARQLRQCRRPVVVCGTDAVPQQVPGLAADLAVYLQYNRQNAGLFYLLPGANAFGAGILSEAGHSWQQVTEGIENGSIKALVVVESDPFRELADGRRLEQALKNLDLLIVLDYINSQTAQKAHILLPSSTIFEAGGIFINQEARLQAARPAFGGGQPIAQSGGGDHPARDYAAGIPGAQPQPAWNILAALVDKNIGAVTGLAWLADVLPEFANLPQLDDIADEGLRFESAADADLRFKNEYASLFDKSGHTDDPLEIILVDWTFGTETLSDYSSCLQALEPEPCATMHVSDASALKLSDGDLIEINTGSHKLELRLRVVDNMSAGVVVIPRHRKVEWQIFGFGKINISKNSITKVQLTTDHGQPTN